MTRDYMNFDENEVDCALMVKKNNLKCTQNSNEVHVLALRVLLARLNRTQHAHKPRPQFRLYSKQWDAKVVSRVNNQNNLRKIFSLGG